MEAIPPHKKATGSPSISEDFLKSRARRPVGLEYQCPCTGSPDVRMTPMCALPTTQYISASQLREPWPLSPGLPESERLLSIVRWLSRFRCLTPQRKEKEQNVFANFVGREQLSDAVGVDCDFILANFH